MANDNLRKALAGVRATKDKGSRIKDFNKSADQEAHRLRSSTHFHEENVLGGPSIPFGYLKGIHYKSKYPSTYRKEERNKDAQRLGIARGLDRDEQLKRADWNSRMANGIAYSTVKHQNLRKALKERKHVTR